MIYDPVSLLHPTIVGEASEQVSRMLHLCGSKIRVLHAKDYEIVDNEDQDVGAMARALVWYATAPARAETLILRPLPPGQPPRDRAL